MKPEVLAWVLLSVIATGILYRFFIRIGRRSDASAGDVSEPSASRAAVATTAPTPSPSKQKPCGSDVSLADPHQTQSARVAAAAAIAPRTGYSQILRPDVKATLAPGTIIQTSTPARPNPVPTTSAQQFSGVRPDVRATIPPRSFNSTLSGSHVSD